MVMTFPNLVLPSSLPFTVNLWPEVSRKEQLIQARDHPCLAEGNREYDCKGHHDLICRSAQSNDNAEFVEAACAPEEEIHSRETA